MNCSFRWNLAYADAYVDLLWEQNIVCLLKSTAEVVQAILLMLMLIYGTVKCYIQNHITEL